MKTEEPKSEKNKPARLIRSFEADADVYEMLGEAMRDGLELGDICNTALREHGTQVISTLLNQRINAASKWSKRSATNSTSPSSDASGVFGAAGRALPSTPKRRRKP